MNEYDSSKMADLLDATHGYQLTDVAEEADVLLLNTAQSARRLRKKSHQLGRWKLLKEKNPDLIIGVGGCVASQEGEHIRQRAHYVDIIIFGPQTLHRLPEMINSVRGDRSPVVDISFRKSRSLTVCRNRAPKGRPRLSPSWKAAKYCTYCVVPYTRGEE